MDDWLTTIALGLVVILIVVLGAATVAKGADPAEQQLTDAPGVQSIQNFDDRTVIQRVQELGPHKSKRVLQRIDYAGQFVVTDWTSGKWGCKKAIEQINNKDFLGLSVEFYTFHKVFFCYNGERVYLQGVDRLCRASQGGLDWYVAGKDESGGYVGRVVGGHWRPNATWHDFVKCRYRRQLLSIVHFHLSTIVVRWNGEVAFKDD